MSKPQQAPAQQPLVRHDPETSGDVDFVTRAQSGIIVHNRDPQRHYTFVSRNQIALTTYAQMGYRQEMRREGGPTVFAEGVDESEGPIQYMGSVLMSIEKSRLKQIKEHGMPEIGAQGSKAFDELEQRIVKTGGVDKMRGLWGRNGTTEYTRVGLSNEVG